MIFIGIFAGIFVLDLLMKKCAEYRLKDKEKRELAGGAVILHRYENPGAALGILTALFLKLVRQPGRTGEKLGLALLLGGGWNNWTDRVIKGSVTDYISFRSRWKRFSRIVFNLSDFAIFAGTALAGLSRSGRRS